MDRTPMRRRINYRLLLWLLAGAAVVTGSLFATRYFQSQRIARALLWQADRAEEQGQIERMAVYLERYREFAPEDMKEAARLAKTWAGEAFAGNFRARRKAVSLLETVLGQDPDQSDLRRLLVRAALELHQLKTARDHLQAMLGEDGTRSGTTPRDGPPMSTSPGSCGRGRNRRSSRARPGRPRRRRTGWWTSSSPGTRNRPVPVSPAGATAASST
jgi:hypothetical protein